MGFRPRPLPTRPAVATPIPTRDVDPSFASIRGRTRRAPVIASCAPGLAAVEAGLRAWELLDSSQTSPGPLNRFDPSLGWASRASVLTTLVKAEFSYPIAINSRGLRDEEVEPKRAGVTRLAVLGDSFVWGWDAADEERFTEALEIFNPCIEAHNFGVSGYGPARYLLQLDDAPSFKPDFVLLIYSLGSDLVDTIVLPDGRQPFAAKAENGLPVRFFPERCRCAYDLQSTGFWLRSLALIDEAVREFYGGDGHDRVLRVIEADDFGQMDDHWHPARTRRSGGSSREGSPPARRARRGGRTTFTPERAEA